MGQNNKEDNCLACKLISGGGLVCAGIYVGRSAMIKSSIVDKFFIGLFGSGLLGLGVARWFDLPPFRHNHNKNQPD